MALFSHNLRLASFGVVLLNFCLICMFKGHPHGSSEGREEQRMYCGGDRAVMEVKDRGCIGVEIRAWQIL